MAGKQISIECADGSFSGYMATPSSGSGPAIVVIQEIFGVNQVMRDVSDDLASQGYIAICPDLFWRIEPGIQLTDQNQEDWAKAFELFGKFDVDAGANDIQATINAARGVDGASGKVGAVGYCLGGQLAYLAATRTDVDASVGFYGVNIQERLGEASKISKPLMLHVAEKDEFVPPEAQATVQEGLAGNTRVTIHKYAEQDHAFARKGGEHFDEAAASLANGRTSDFFAANLK
jgi:carboxymethylenebutenolidase